MSLGDGAVVSREMSWSKEKLNLSAFLVIPTGSDGCLDSCIDQPFASIWYGSMSVRCGVRPTLLSTSSTVTPEAVVARAHAEPRGTVISFLHQLVARTCSPVRDRTVHSLVLTIE